MDLYSPAAKQMIGSNQRTNSFTSLRLVLACHVATSTWPNPLILPRSANNFRGIPSKYREAVIIAVGHDRDSYTKLNQQHYRVKKISR